MRKILFGLFKIESISKNNDKKISYDIMYQEYMAEMRRFRDYELSSSTWYTAFIMAINGFFINIMYGNDFYNFKKIIESNTLIQICIATLIILFGFSGVFSVRWAKIRYEKLKNFVFNNDVNKKYIPDDYNFTPDSMTKLRPVSFIYIVQIILTILSIVIVSWTSGFTIVMIFLVIAIILFVTLFCCILP